MTQGVPLVNSAASASAEVSSAIAQLFDAQQKINRAQAIVAALSSGYGGTSGTQVESGSGVPNPFQIQPYGGAGVAGAAYIYALGTLNTAINSFMSTNSGSIAALDTLTSVD